MAAESGVNMQSQLGEVALVGPGGAGLPAVSFTNTSVPSSPKPGTDNRGCKNGALMDSFGIFLQGLLAVMAFSILMCEYEQMSALCLISDTSCWCNTASSNSTTWLIKCAIDLSWRGSHRLLGHSGRDNTCTSKCRGFTVTLHQLTSLAEVIPLHLTFVTRYTVIISKTKQDQGLMQTAVCHNERSICFVSPSSLTSLRNVQHFGGFSLFCWREAALQVGGPLPAFTSHPAARRVVSGWSHTSVRAEIEVTICCITCLQKKNTQKAHSKCLGNTAPLNF